MKACALLGCDAEFAPRTSQKYCCGEHAQRASRGYSLSYRDFLDDIQKGGCGICGRTADETGRGPLVVDHNHETGKIRGLLCQDCNMAIGAFDEDVDRMYDAISYLFLGKVYDAVGVGEDWGEPKSDRVGW